MNLHLQTLNSVNIQYIHANEYFLYLEYHGFEEYDGGRLSRVGRQTPAVMVPPGWPEPELKKGSYLSL